MYFDWRIGSDGQELVPVGTEREVLDTVRTHGLDTIRTVARSLDISYGEAGYYVRKLRAVGLLDARWGSDGLVLRPTP